MAQRRTPTSTKRPVGPTGAAMVGLVGLVGLASVIGVACSSDNQAFAIDTSTIRAGVAADLAQAGLTLTSIDCPAAAQPTAGAPIACSVTLGDGSKVGLDVGLTGDPGSQRLTWKLGPDLVSTGPLVADLTTFARAAVSDDLNVTCPRVVVLAGGNGRLTCEVTDAAGQKGALSVPVQDGQPVADHDRWSVDQS